MCRPPSSGRVRRRACGLAYPASGLQSRPSVALHVCVLTGAPRRPPFHAPIPPATSTDCPAVSDRGGRRWFPALARHLRADGRCTSPVALPPYPSPWPFWARNCRLCWSSAGGMGSRHRPGTAPGPADDRPSPLGAPAGDPTPITQVKVRTRAKSGRNRLPVSHLPNR